MILFAGTSTGGDEAFTFGNIKYPVYGNVQMDEGTVELWVTPCFDPYEKTASNWYVRAQILSLVLMPGKEMTIAWAIKANPRDKDKGVASQIWVNFPVKGGNRLWLATPVTVNWEQNVPVHVAVTWKGRDCRLFINGRKVSEVTQPGDIENEVSSDAVLYLGSKYSAVSLVVLEQLRISSIVRDEKALAFFASGPLEPDPYTLLLDSFSSVRRLPNGLTETCAAVMAKAGGMTGGIMSAACRLVDGKTGKGVALFTQKTAEKEK